MKRFFLQGHEFDFHPDGAVFLVQERTLVVADLHLGKSAAFRAGGLPVPEGDAERDLLRMEALVQETGALALVVAGDLFHGATGMTGEIEGLLDGFLQRVGVPVSLVIGNHDRKVKRLPAGLRVGERMMCGSVRVVHDPEDVAEDGVVTITGHWHPVVRIKDGKRTALRLPCFLLRGNVLVLPSFGSFTGGRIVSPVKGDRVFVGMREEVVEVPAKVQCL
jgi:DNA ligase-associated metallophosphoesterase